MISELESLLDMPALWLAVLVFGLFIGASVEGWRRDRKRRAWRERNGWRRQGDRTVPGSVTPGSPQGREPGPAGYVDATEQLGIVMAADFWMKPLLNTGEARLFKEVDRMVLARNPGWQVMAQVSLGEILRCKDEHAYRCVNSKRVDLLLVDEDCRPRHAIEYQGDGHFQRAAAARDAVKKEALRKARIGYFEVVQGRMTPPELRRLIDKLVDPPKSEANKLSTLDRELTENEPTKYSA